MPNYTVFQTFDRGLAKHTTFSGTSSELLAWLKGNLMTEVTQGFYTPEDIEIKRVDQSKEDRWSSNYRFQAFEVGRPHEGPVAQLEANVIQTI